MDTRLESEQMQAQPMYAADVIPGAKIPTTEKKQTPWKMPEFYKEDVTYLYAMPDDWKLLRVITPEPYKDHMKNVITHCIEPNGKTWIFYTDETVTTAIDWLADNENFKGLYY